MVIDVDAALGECRDAIRGSIEQLSVADGELDAFVAVFRTDFEREFQAAQARKVDKWSHDRQRVTALARAIGAFAEFLAVADSAQYVSNTHLTLAYRVIGPSCKPPAGIVLAREYCTNVRKTMGL